MSDGVGQEAGVEGRADAPHPGEVLRKEFMEPHGFSANALARQLRVPPNRVTAILNGTRSVTADTALRLSRFFGNAPEYWLGLQQRYELELARREVGMLVVREVSPLREGGDEAATD